MSDIEHPTTVEDVEAILVENARLVNQRQYVFLRPLADGCYRLQNKNEDGHWLRGRANRKDYPTLEALCSAAKIALLRARRIASERVA